MARLFSDVLKIVELVWDAFNMRLEVINILLFFQYLVLESKLVELMGFSGSSYFFVDSFCNFVNFWLQLVDYVSLLLIVFD